jgi:phage tail tape-measure protein
MKALIVGRYSQLAVAETASRELLRAGFSAREMSLFYVNPQGQHALYPVGGDEDESAGTHEAKSGAVRGAIGGVGAGTLVGVATIPVLGPAAPLLGAAVGAYTGSLVGALSHMEEPDTHGDAVRDSDEPDADVQPRQAGVMLAVAVATPAEREYAIEILGVSAQQVEAAEGLLQYGEWIDFDPLAPGKVIR